MRPLARRRRYWEAALAIAALCCVSCGTSDEEQAQCGAPIAADCAPLYTPTYGALFDRTFNPSCGVAGSSCHQSGGDGTHGGLTFDNPARTYSALLDASRSWKLVDTARPECSKIVYKISSHDVHVMMPPGRPLSAAEQCGIERWILDGAKQ